MSEECQELICAPPDLFEYDIRSETPLLVSWGGDEIPLLLSDGEHILT
jgi:hypothetical protein